MTHTFFNTEFPRKTQQRALSVETQTPQPENLHEVRAHQAQTTETSALTRHVTFTTLTAPLSGWTEALVCASVCAALFFPMFLLIKGGTLLGAGLLFLGCVSVGFFSFRRAEQQTIIPQDVLLKAFDVALPEEREALLEATAVLPVRMKAWEHLAQRLQQTKQDDPFWVVRERRRLMADEALRTTEEEWQHLKRRRLLQPNGHASE